MIEEKCMNNKSIKELYEGLNSNQSSDKPNKKSTGLRD